MLLAHCRPGRCEVPGIALSRHSTIRHQPYQAAGPVGAEPDRSTPDRTARRRPQEKPKAPTADDAGRVSGSGEARFFRSEERRVGQAVGIKARLGWARDPEKN